MFDNMGKVELQVELTHKKYNIICAELSPGSHQKVVVKCVRCNEIFTREFRNLGKLHFCPLHVVSDDGVKLKWCNKCKQFLSYDAFGSSKTRYDKLSVHCLSCMSVRKQGVRGYTNIIEWLRIAIPRKRNECHNKGIPFDVDFEYLLDQYEKQDGRCFYAKVQLLFTNHDIRSASLERLDSSLGYIKGNVVIACKAMNWAKKSTAEYDFIQSLNELIIGLTGNIRLEAKLLDSDAMLPSRKRSSDAGYDVASIEDVVISPHTMVNVNTGIIVSPPDGVYYTVEGRSSLWMKGIVPVSGIIDGTYQGPLIIALNNNSDKPFEIRKGDRIAQIIIHKVMSCDFTIVREFSPIQDGRASEGFGSTGRGGEHGLSDGSRT